MILYRNNKYGARRFFFAPDTGASPNGQPASAAAQQGGAAEVDPTASAVSADPFAGIDLDDLDPAARKVIEAAKTTFATTQKQAEQERKGREHFERLARKNQSGYDQLKAQVDKLTGNGTVSQDDPKSALLAKFTKTLTDKNVPEEQAKMQAGIMLEMFAEYGGVLKGEIGRDLAPFAGSVLMQEATNAWHQAAQNDKLGALQIPEVAERVWANAQELANNNQPVTAATIKNLASMAYVDHIETHGAPNTPPPVTPAMPYPTAPRYPNVGTPSYPGAVPFRPQVPDPNAARHALDPATAAAISKIKGEWQNDVPSMRKGGRK